MNPSLVINDTLEIPTAHLDYPLHSGYVDDWLVAGPVVAPVVDLARFAGPDAKVQIARAMYREESGITQPPAERASFSLGAGEGSGERLLWRVMHCAEDHAVELGGYYSTCAYLCAWAYAQVVAPQSLQAEFVLTTHGPADLWLNGEHVHRQAHFGERGPQGVHFAARLVEGTNEVLVRFEAVAMRDCPFAMALQIAGTGDAGYRVVLPTTLEPVARRQQLAGIMQQAYLVRDVFSGSDPIEVHWPPSMSQAHDLTVRLQTPAGRIHGEVHAHVTGGAVVSLGAAHRTPEGRYEVLLMSRPEEYYVHNMRVQHRLPLRIAGERYTQESYGTFEQRRKELLEDAARRNQDIFSEIAKMELGHWADVRSATIDESIERIERRADGSVLHLLGVLAMLARYADQPAFRKELEFALADCVLGFRYWEDEPGEDVMDFGRESIQLAYHACEVLAGQLYPERVFANAELTGAEHREKGERLALAWLDARAAYGFRMWDAPASFAEIVAVLAHLADLAQSVEVAEMAAVVLDKLLFSLAVNSYRGVFGSSHGRVRAAYCRSGRLEPTAGISRLLWGMGLFNDHLLGPVSLACAARYRMPEIIAAIALDQPDEIWSRERHALPPAAGQAAEESWEVNKVTYRTPDGMLCSAQAYRPGQEGDLEHIWQATLGPDAVVFGNHPACTADDSPGGSCFWQGNRLLPHVVQWKGTLVALHRLPEDDRMGFTHAYFPQAAFDETLLRDGWAFARKGAGYLALTAAQGVHLITGGRSAYRELRSAGRENIWLCHLGRAALDGSFADFVDKVLALEMSLTGLSARLESLRGEVIAVNWGGPLLVNGSAQPTGGYAHYDTPYCLAPLPAQAMELHLGDNRLRLAFGGGK